MDPVMSQPRMNHGTVTGNVSFPLAQDEDPQGPWMFCSKKKGRDEALRNLLHLPSRNGDFCSVFMEDQIWKKCSGIHCEGSCVYSRRCTQDKIASSQDRVLRIFEGQFKSSNYDRIYNKTFDPNLPQKKTQNNFSHKIMWHFLIMNMFLWVANGLRGVEVGKSVPHR